MISQKEFLWLIGLGFASAILFESQYPFSEFISSIMLGGVFGYTFTRFIQRIMEIENDKERD